MSTLTAPTKDLPPAEARRSGINSSIRTKISFWTGLSLALVSVILIGYSVTTLRQTSIDDSTREALAISQARAGAVQSQLELPLFVARTLADSLEAVKDPAIPTSLSRDQVNAMLRKVLIENPSFLGTYTLWEPEAFDGQDAKYVRAQAHDETGRFIPYWVRGDDGIIHTEALAQYEMPGVGDWYVVPRSTKQEATIAPIFRKIQGQDVVIASFVIPVVEGDKFYGIAGVDAPIGFVQEMVDSIDLYNGTANAVLFTESGSLIAVRQRPDLTNQPATQIYSDFQQLQPRLSTPFTRLSPDGQYLQTFAPIQVNEGSQRWVIGLIIPLQAITASATTAAIRQVAISSGFIVLALVFLWFLAGQIVHPMQELTKVAQRLSQGEFTVTADVRSRDEVGLLAGAFNLMTTELRELFSTLEQRVAERTRALAASAEVSRRLSTLLDERQLVSEVVEQVKSAFDYYHAHIYLADEASGELVMAGGTGDVGRALLSRGHRVARGKGLVGRAAESRQAVLVSDVTQDPEWLPNPLLPETKSEVAVPIAIGEQVLGVLDVQHNVVNGLKQDDVDLLQSIANQVAIGVRNAQSYSQVQERAEREALIASIGQKIQTASTVETALQVALRELAAALGSRSARVVIQTPRLAEAGPQTASIKS